MMDHISYHEKLEKKNPLEEEAILMQRKWVLLKMGLGENAQNMKI